MEMRRQKEQKLSSSFKIIAERDDVTAGAIAFLGRSTSITIRIENPKGNFRRKFLSNLQRLLSGDQTGQDRIAAGN